MNYLEYLVIFVIIPLIIILMLNIYQSKKDPLNRYFRGISPVFALMILSFVALAYTTPWDNYLVMTGVWFYEKTRIIGFLIGYVPIEEYIFFVAQTLLVGSFVYFILRFQKDINPVCNRRMLIRVFSGIGIMFIWILSILLILIKSENTSYLSLILSWALPPIFIQVLFGVDIIWSHRKLALMSILISTIYFSLTDSFAISQGIWTIAPSTSLNWLLGGVLPFEEMVFFLITNMLITFGTILLSDIRSMNRIKETIRKTNNFESS